MALMTLRDYGKRGMPVSRNVLHGPIDKLTRSCSELYKLNGAEKVDWESDLLERLRIVVDFFTDAVGILNESKVPEHTAWRVREKYGWNHTIYDDFAEGIAELVFESSAVRSPMMFCWMVQHNMVWGELFNFEKGKEEAARLIQFKVRRLIYDGIREMEKFPNFKGAKLLGFSLNVLGLKVRNEDSFSDSLPLQKAVLSWTRRNFAGLYDSNPTVAKSCLVDGFTYQRTRLRIVKTYPAEGLRRKPQHEYLEVLPFSSTREDRKPSTTQGAE
jgi:hypothetical protein